MRGTRRAGHCPKPNKKFCIGVMPKKEVTIKLKSSRGEIKICDILDAAGLVYKEEYTFPDLVSSSGRPLRFDFCVFDDNGDIDFLIEYQGIQHY